jgi:hypothetical protein
MMDFSIVAKFTLEKPIIIKAQQKSSFNFPRNS